MLQKVRQARLLHQLSVTRPGSEIVLVGTVPVRPQHTAREGGSPPRHCRLRISPQTRCTDPPVWSDRHETRRHRKL
jgi:hypothetical protein